MQTPLILIAGPGTSIPTLSQAITLLPPDDGTPAEIRLAPGVYREKIVLARANTTLTGESAQSTRIVWGDGAFEQLPDGMNRGTFRTATLRTDAPRVTLRNLTIENDAAPRETAGQAIALYADGDGLLCEDCVLLGAQDTLFTAPLPPKEIQKNGFIGPKQFAPRLPQRHTYRRCRIVGDIDFIFGGAAAWFEACDIVSIDGRSDRSKPYVGYATAASTPEGQAFGYVFADCRFLSEGCADGSVYLGRPWRDWAKTVLLRCELGAHIVREGFHDWRKPLAREVCFYAEHGCFGPGAAPSSARAPFVRRLTDAQAAGFTYEAFWASMETRS